MDFFGREWFDISSVPDPMVDFFQPSFLHAMLFILGSPVGWNILGRLEYYTRCFTKLFRSKFVGCYFMAAYIFIFSAFRNYFFYLALLDQPVLSLSPPLSTFVKFLSVLCYVWGAILVVSASWALGIVGTYNGDYFGLLMEERLTHFPFNKLKNPMYVGSSLLFLAQALWKFSPAGVLLSVWVYLVYKTCCVLFEEPFTAYIYSQAALESENERLLREAQIEMKAYTPITTVEDVLVWLERLGMEKYKRNFEENRITGVYLNRLDMKLLKDDLKIEPLGDRFLLHDAIVEKKKSEEKMKMWRLNLNKWISERKAIEKTVAKVMDEVVKQGVNSAKLNVERIVKSITKDQIRNKSLGVKAKPKAG